MDAQWEGKSKTTPLGIQFFLWLLKIGGLPAAYSFLPFVTFWYRKFSKKATDPLEYLYEQRMQKGKKEARSLVKKNLIAFGESLLDKIALISNVPNQINIIHENTEDIDMMKSSGTGGILLSAHIGNWEAAGHMLKRFNWVVNILMYDGEAQNIKRTMNDTNQKRSFNMIPIQDDGSHIYEIKAALSRGELICINADRYRPGNKTYTANFLGKDALFPAGPFILGAKLGVPVSFTFALKENRNTYIYRAHPAKVYSRIGDTGAKEMLQDFVATMEKELKEYPEQWYNYYPFWNEANY